MTDVLKGTANRASRPTKPNEAAAAFRVDIDGVVLEWNAAMERLTGRVRDAVLGKPASGLQCPGCTLPTCPFAPQDLAAISESPVETVETCLRLADGEIIPVLKTTRPVHGPGGFVTGAEVALVSGSARVR